MAIRNKIVFFVNEKRIEADEREAQMMLADFLRYRGWTGTKVVCAEGDCGACTVLRYKVSPTTNSAIKNFKDANDWTPLNSCIAMVAQMDGSIIATIDGLAKRGDNDQIELTEPQRAMMDCHASQCGYCTPGFVMALTGLVEKVLPDGKLNEQGAKNAFTGNLCRCTGYKPIIEAAVNVDLRKCESLSFRFLNEDHLNELCSLSKDSVLLKSDSFLYFAPTTLQEAVHWLGENPEARIMGALTDLGVLINKRKIQVSKWINLDAITELHEINTVTEDCVSVGARVSLSRLREFIKPLVPEFANLLDIFASPQIKNVATLVGNVANASPIGDTPPFLLSADAKVSIIGLEGRREIDLTQFYLGYRQTVLKKGELITSIQFKIPKSDDMIWIKKVSERKDLDISSVNVAFWLVWKDRKKKIISSLKMSAGGLAATPVRFFEAEALAQEQILTKEFVDSFVICAQGEVRPMSDVRGSSSFRRVLLENLIRRFFLEALK